MQSLNNEASRLVKKKITYEQFDRIVEELIPLPEKRQDNALRLRHSLYSAWDRDNISNFKFTAWGVINAVSDFVTHTPPARITAVSQQRLFEKIIDGHDMIDTALQMIKAM